MSPRRYALWTAGLCLILAASGCSIYSAPGGQPAPVENRSPTPPTPPPDPSPPQPAPPPPEPNASNAYGPLLDRADEAASRGDYEQALALLERAQRIDPDSGEIYLALAQTYAAKGDRALSRSTAERGLLYCGAPAECDALRELTR